MPSRILYCQKYVRQSVFYLLLDDFIGILMLIWVRTLMFLLKVCLFSGQFSMNNGHYFWKKLIECSREFWFHQYFLTSQTFFFEGFFLKTLYGSKFLHQMREKFQVVRCSWKCEYFNIMRKYFYKCNKKYCKIEKSAIFSEKKMGFVL